LISLVLHRDALRNGLQALKPSGRLEVSALLATVQIDAALRTLALPIHILRQGSGAVKTSGRHDVLQKARKPRTSYINGRPWTRRFWAFGGTPVLVAVRIHIPALSVFSIIVHALNRFPGVRLHKVRELERGGANLVPVQEVGSIGGKAAEPARLETHSASAYLLCTTKTVRTPPLFRTIGRNPGVTSLLSANAPLQ
jgi:hypothetical protein